MSKKTTSQVPDDVEAALKAATTPPLHEQYTTEELVGAYIKLRDGVKAREAALKEELKPDKALMQDIEDALSLVLDAAGSKSLKTELGTAGYRVSRSAKVVDRMALDEYVFESGHMELFESRVCKSALLELAEESGEVPPGIEVNEYKKVVVTAPRSR